MEGKLKTIEHKINQDNCLDHILPAPGHTPPYINITTIPTQLSKYAYVTFYITMVTNSDFTCRCGYMDNLHTN